MKNGVRMSIPIRVGTVIYSPWELLPGTQLHEPLASSAVNDPVVKPKTECAGNEKDPPENCLCHLCTLPSETSPDTLRALPIFSP